ncbi:DNA polymerase IV [Nocardioides sp. TRM66260-LWL]|uniref:DNA polymerase IV n=1 Tax=Nocardioides sp. TRM66260-LWL TaxID=2874478 RepID=UPI001CC62086|nr:DNA polymerase IV [Nocardioides sp. TRM66260-LWL]MBZ5733710.1 DNA polymerase IV [Nocardioides sp. TRM66260-LWL]
MRASASVLHLDLDAFFAAVEQRDKPSLRGRPVIVGGVGGRGVVATASYEARRFGVRSAMSTREARARCPHAAFLSGRFPAYRATSRAVMAVLRAVSPLVEPLSLDEAYVDLEAVDSPDLPDLEVPTVTAFAELLRERVHEASGGLTASVGVGTSKLMAKIASDLRKPDGLVVVAPGTERALLDPMPASVIPGVGPATVERLRRAGLHTVADVADASVPELVTLLGRAHGEGLHRLARAEDDRPVVAEREAKSVSVESTYDTDLMERRLLESIVTRQAGEVAARLAKAGQAGRTVTLKVRLHDFTTLSRSATLPSPTDSGPAIGRLARTLLGDLIDQQVTAGGVRLLGVGVSGLADWVQEDLFGDLGIETSDPDQRGDPGDPGEPGEPDAILGATPDADAPPVPPEPRGRAWPPGLDVEHEEHGRGWVWGAGRGVVTVRFETADSPAGPVRSFRDDDPALRRVPWPSDDEADEADDGTAPAG